MITVKKAKREKGSKAGHQFVLLVGELFFHVSRKELERLSRQATRLLRNAK
jgi:hypothetical protein